MVFSQFTIYWVLEVLAAVLGGGLLFYAAITKFTTLAAVVQMGSIQERTMPWAQVTKVKGQIVAESLSTALSSGAEKVTKVAAKTTSTIAQKVVKAEDPLESVMMWDKITYTASLVNVMITAYLAGAAPGYFYLWHSPKAIIYTAHRWYTFKQQNQHYLLYDFCYWANALAIVYCWIFPQSDYLFRIVFMVANGPLAWAVLAFSQSLIFHSAPHMTSVFIHVSPMVLSYCLRWNASSFRVCDNWPACDGPETSVPNLLWEAHTGFYLWWVVIYYVWVYGVMSRRIKERGYKTLFDRVVQRGPTKFLTKISGNEAVQRAAYMLVHVVFATFTMLLATAYWRSQLAHTVFIILIVATSAWNASGFYFTVFANRYSAEARQRAGLSDGSEGCGK